MIPNSGEITRIYEKNENIANETIQYTQRRQLNVYYNIIIKWAYNPWDQTIYF